MITDATIDVDIKRQESEVEGLIGGSPLFNDLQGNNDDMNVSDSKVVEKDLPTDRESFNQKIAELKSDILLSKVTTTENVTKSAFF